MIKHITILVLLFVSTLAFTQDINYKEYSYSELFKLIEDEKDSIFELSDALILINRQTDSLFMLDGDKPIRQKPLVISKEIKLDRVHFENPIFRSNQGKLREGFLANIHFKKAVSIRNTATIFIVDCEFDDYVNIGGSGFFCSQVNTVENMYGLKDRIQILESIFKNGLRFFFNCNYQDDILNTQVEISGNEFRINNQNQESTIATFVGHQFGDFMISRNSFHGPGEVSFFHSGNGLWLYGNTFKNANATIRKLNENTDVSFDIVENQFDKSVLLGFSGLKKTHSIDLKQFKEGFKLANAWSSYLYALQDTLNDNGNAYFLYRHSDSLYTIFQNT